MTGGAIQHAAGDWRETSSRLNAGRQDAKDLRAWFDDCHEDVVWDIIRGGDHDKEDRALDRKKALAILD